MRFDRLNKFRTGGFGSSFKVSVPPPKTPDGRVYRYSPDENAHPRFFLLGEVVADFLLPEEQTARMTHMPRTPGTVCPYGGTKADDDEFTHPDDMEAVQEIVANAVFNDVADQFHIMFADLARRHSGSKSLKITTGPRPTPTPVPRFVRNDLLRELVCDECGRDYGVFAISLFCPDCGAPNIHLNFAREVALVRQQVEIAGKLAPEQSELAYRLLGNAHEDVLTAFEATQKAVYNFKVSKSGAAQSDIKPVANAFQSIEKARKRFGEFGFDPVGNLSPEVFEVLLLNIQKRHVIGHNLGIADAAFAQHAEDARLGETIPLVGDDILQFAEICHMVVNGLDAWLANGVPPPQGRDVLSKPIAALQSKTKMAIQIGELGPLAISIGIWAARTSEKGLNDFVQEDALLAEFSNATEEELRFAIAELSKDGYLKTTPYMGMLLPNMQRMTDLYLEFDPLAGKGDPASDVVELVDLVLKSGESHGTETLHEAIGWPLRRFNPTFGYMLSQIDERRHRGYGSADYATHGFLLLDDDKVNLHRFANRLREHPSKRSS